MPQQYVQGGQDWAPVNAGRSSSSSGGLKAVPKTTHDLNLAKARGLVTTEKRIGAGGNQSAHSAGVISARKLEEADDVGTIAKVDKSLSKAIMQARTAKKLTQKELATAINEKPQIVGEYESGKAVPNPAIISKLERALGVKLPRPGKSKPPPKEGSSATGTSSTSKSGPSGKVAALTRGGPPKLK